VADHELSLEQLEEVGEVAAIRHMLDEVPVLLIHRGPVFAVHRRVVEELPEDAPRLAVHLAPLGSGIDLDRHASQIQAPVAGIDASLGVGNVPRATAAIEQFAAVGAQGNVVGAFEHRRRLRALDGELLEGAAREVEHRALCGSLHHPVHVAVARDAHGQDTLVDTLEVDIDEILVLLIGR